MFGEDRDYVDRNLDFGCILATNRQQEPYGLMSRELLLTNRDDTSDHTRAAQGAVAATASRVETIQQTENKGVECLPSERIVAQGTCLFCLFGCCCSCFSSLLPVTLDHDHAQERTHDRGTEESQNDRYADGPDSRWKKALKRVVSIDKRLQDCQLRFSTI